MELSGQNLLIAAVVLAIVITAIVMIFRNQYKTEEERSANQGKLVLWIILGVVGVLVVGWLLISSGEGNGEEYGVFAEAKRNVKNYWARHKAYREAKKGGATDEEAKVARANLKAEQTAIKKAGREAEAAVSRQQKDARMAAREAAGK
jgi:hypothetical protein